MRFWTPISAIVALLALAPGAFAGSMARATRVDRPPHLDGRLDDPVWAKAEPFTGFTLLGSAEQATQQTRFRVCFDDRTLYLAIECSEKAMDKLVAKVRRAEGQVWEDDSVEVFLAPFADRARYYHFLVNARGTLRDEEVRDPALESGWRARTRRGPDGWVAEIAIPFRDLALTSESAKPWGFNVARTERPAGELSAWAPIATRTFHEPSQFGLLDSLTVDFSRYAAQTLDGRLDGLLSGLRKPSKTAKRFERKTAFGKELFGQLTLLRLDADEMFRALKGRPDIAALGPIEQRCTAVEARLARLSSRASRLQMIGAVLDGVEPDFVLCRESTMRKVRPDQPYEGAAARSVDIALARNEYEAAQIVVVPARQSLDAVMASCSPLTGPGGAVLDPVDLRLVAYVAVKQPSEGSTGKPGRYPDPLLPFEPFTVPTDEVRSLWLTVHAQPDQPAGLYRGELTMAPKGLPPRKLPVEVKVWDFALPATPRLRTSFSIDASAITRRHQANEAEAQRLLREYRLDALRHRISDCHVAGPRVELKDAQVAMDWADFDREIAFYLDHGLTGFDVDWCRLGGGWGKAGELANPQQIAAAAELLRQTQEHLAAKGWLGKAYVYVIDEPGQESFPQVKAAFNLVRQAAPKLKTLLTYGLGATRPWKPGAQGLPAYAALAGLVDIHVPHTDCFDPVYLETRRKAGDAIWAYVCISAQPPYANNWGIDFPGTDARGLYWQLWQNRVAGFLYWRVNHWEVDVWTNPMSYPGGNGDGSLLYPGPAGPVPSIRWELNRDGIEDYDLLCLLRDQANALSRRHIFLQWRARHLLNVSDVTRSWTELTRDPNEIESHRREMGDAIEEITRILRAAARGKDATP